MNRKLIFVILLMLASLLLSACASPATSQPATEAPSVEEEQPAAEGGGKLEVFSWWTSGGEAAALDTLFNQFKVYNPTAEIINATIAGGGGSNARAVLQTRLGGGDPPDTWQVHPGYELMGQYVASGYVDPITDLYKSEGWDKVMPQGLVDQMTKDGEIYGVLAGVHRGNGLWYNKTVLDGLGITVGETMSPDQFFEIAEKVKAAGIDALCVGDTGVWA